MTDMTTAHSTQLASRARRLLLPAIAVRTSKGGLRLARGAYGFSNKEPLLGSAMA
jgi:hypothetical protein